MQALRSIRLPFARAASHRVFRSPAFWIRMSTALVCLVILGIQFGQEQRERLTDIRQTQTASFNLARSLAQHADDTFEMADTILLGLTERLQRDGRSPDALARLGSFMQVRATHNSRIKGLFIYEEDGRWLASSLNQRPGNVTNDDRDYFRQHRESDDLGPLLGPPVRSRSGGQWIVTLSRRYNHPDGRFAGVVLASVDVAYFSGFYSKFDVGQEGSIALANASGLVLARYPDAGNYVGRSIAGSEIFRGRSADRPAGSVLSRSPLDGVDRFVGFQRGTKFPLVALATVSEAEALAGWRSSALGRFVATGLLLLVIVALGSRLLAYIRRHQKAESALAGSEANFRLLAENSHDMVSKLTAEGIRQYVSPASLQLLGRRPEQLVGTSALDEIRPDDKPAVQAAAARLRSRLVDSITVTYRAERADGREIWLETSIRIALRPGSGEPNGAVAVTRDVTQRKGLEAELATLARTDALTGLCNRRAFDEKLAMEWSRAERDGTDLSLVLFDLDRFKLFNDTYGHQSGDACLRSVAEVVKRLARRPTDMAARYGGEELAILLPGTDLDGAVVVAEAIRLEVAALAVPHSGNTPLGIVTISGGAASHDASSSAVQLVVAADTALYEAKHLGRNRISARPSTALRMTG